MSRFRSGLPVVLSLLAFVCATGLAQEQGQGGHSLKHEGDGSTHRPHGDEATVHHSFDDAKNWAKRFEDPRRDAWQLPDEVVAKLVTRKDMVIADIGSATGYFPVRFARACPKGVVIGADIEPDMIHYLNDRAREEKLTNLFSVLAAPDDPHLPLRADLVFICDTYHHIDGRIDYFERLQRQLRKGGRVAVVDFRPESQMGPPHKLDPGIVESEMKSAGYRLAKSYDFLPEQYFLVFEMEKR